MALFDPIDIGSVTLPNRMVKSAMGEGAADTAGRPTPSLLRMYSRWAAGGIGLAITGMACIRQNYTFTGRELGLYSDDLIRPLRELTRIFRPHDGKLFAQICHAPPQLPRDKARVLGAVAPSARFYRTDMLWHRSLRNDELWSLVRDFGAAARRAREAGFDGIQLHAAHGYLLSRMLSPRDNRRRDAWGGSFEGRLRFLREVYGEVRRAVGDDYPVTIKLNAHDALRGGLELSTSLRIARRLERWGIDGIEVSAGVAEAGFGCFPNRGGIPPQEGKAWLGREFPFFEPIMPVLDPLLRLVSYSLRLRQEAYFFEFAKKFASAVSVPVICVGGIRSPQVAVQILSTSDVAMVSLARPLVRQPALPRRWRAGSSEAAQCVSCNKCFVQLGLDQSLRCWHRRGSGQ